MALIIVFVLFAAILYFFWRQSGKITNVVPPQEPESPAPVLEPIVAVDTTPPVKRTYKKKIKTVPEQESNVLPKPAPTGRKKTSKK